MREVSVDKNALREILLKNRAEHRAIFEEAVEGYRKEAIKQLEAHIARIQEGKVMRVAISLPVPQDHTDDYDRVIKMIDMSVDETLILDEERFAQYVMDNWSWVGQFSASTSPYSALSRGKFGGE